MLNPLLLWLPARELLRFSSRLAAVSLALALAGCAARPAVTLTVFAAASLAEPFRALGQSFQAAHPSVRVEFNFAGSQQLAAQITQGAPADVFASANAAQMEAAGASGRVGPAEVFALNRLVIVYPADNPGRLHTLGDLARPGLRVVLAAAAVPAGQYALEFLERASQAGALGPDYRDRVLQNVVSYEDNVKQVLAKVALGEAEAGLVYATDVLSGTAGQVAELSIPDELNPVARYPIAVLTDSAQAELAQAFVEAVRSPAGQQLLAGYGFSPPPAPAPASQPRRSAVK